MTAKTRAKDQRPWLVITENDLHAGSTVAAVPPEGVRLDDGGYYKPSPLNTWLWDRRERVWSELRTLAKGCRVAVVFNGDLFDGDHHGTTQILSGNPEAQHYVATRMMDAVEAIRPERVYVVRGTDAHVGEAASAEEGFAKGLAGRLPVVRDPETHLWSYWRLDVDFHHVRCNWAHHANVGGMPWTAPASINRLAFRIWSEAALRHWEYPHLAFRAHSHATIPGGRLLDSHDAYPTRAILVPSWQAKTGYAHKRVTEAVTTFGLVATLIPPDSPYTVIPFLVQPDPPKRQRA